MRLRLETDTFISVNHYKKYRFYNGVVTPFKTKETKDFEKVFERHIREQMAKQGWSTPPKEFLIRVDTTFIFPRTNCDANNYFKVLLDVCTQAGVWVDDSRVKENVKKVFYNSKNPKIILDIYIDEQVGVFKDTDNYYQFKKKCTGCKRYKRNCSILNGAMEGKISEGLYSLDEYESWVCSKYNPGDIDEERK